MTKQTQVRLTDLVESTKERLGDLSSAQKQEILETIKEAKKRGLLKGQPWDRCLNRYINIGNHLLRIYRTDEFTTVFENIDQLYVYVGLISTNSITAATA